MNVIELMQIHARNSGFAPAGVIYKPRDDMRIAIPLVEELIAAADELLYGPAETAALATSRLAKALAQVQS